MTAGSRKTRQILGIPIEFENEIYEAARAIHREEGEAKRAEGSFQNDPVGA